jgi:hypothetical protein
MVRKLDDDGLDIKAWEQANEDLRTQLSREYERYERINDRAIQLLSLNGLLPAIFVLVGEPNTSSLLSIQNPYFGVGTFLLLSSVLISLIVYYFNRRPTPPEIEENDFESRVLRQNISEEDYLLGIMNKRVNNLEDFYRNNRELEYPLFVAFLSFLLGSGSYLIFILISG